MKRCFAIFSLSLLILIFALSLPAFAQEELNERYPGVDQKPALETRKEPADFGQKDWAYTWLGASDFSQEDGPAHRMMNTDGYYGRAADSGLFFSATIKLPSGSEIKRLILYAYDNHQTYNIAWIVFRSRIDLPGPREQLFRGPPTGAEGYSMRYVDPVGFNFDNYHLYTIDILMPEIHSAHRFKGVRIAYQRQISPAPTTATFPDVPTTHGFFRNIEALAASGITTGFSDGTYKPNDYVTRGQMAAFLSRALGLHHPENAF